MSWTHVADRTVTARKIHRCRVCAEVIQVGETAVKRFGFDDGPVSSYFHPECETYSARYWIGDDSGAWDSIPGGISRMEVLAELKSVAPKGEPDGL